jgi:hypothetical protein
MHILEGRQLVLLNIDEEVIAIIRRMSPSPLMERFKLTERQADDILDSAAYAACAPEVPDRAGAEGTARRARQPEVRVAPARLPLPPSNLKHSSPRFIRK